MFDNTKYSSKKDVNESKLVDKRDLTNTGKEDIQRCVKGQKLKLDVKSFYGFLLVFYQASIVIEIQTIIQIYL